MTGFLSAIPEILHKPLCILLGGYEYVQHACVLLIGNSVPRFLEGYTPKCPLIPEIQTGCIAECSEKLAPFFMQAYKAFC